MYLSLQKSFAALILLVAAVSADVSHILAPQKEYLPPQHHTSYEAPLSHTSYDTSYAPAAVQYETYSAPAVQTYAAPAAHTYAAPAVQTYAAPAVQTYAAQAVQYAAPAIQTYAAPAVQAYAAPAAEHYGTPAVSFQNYNSHHSSYDVPATSSFSSYAAPLTQTAYSAPAVSAYSSGHSHGNGYQYGSPIYKRV